MKYRKNTDRHEIQKNTEKYRKIQATGHPDIKTHMQSHLKKINYKKIQPMQVCLQSV